MSESVVIIGGDGFCAWPIALRLSRKSYDVTVIESPSWCERTTREPAALPIWTRIMAWNAMAEHQIILKLIEIETDFDGLCACLKDARPTTVIYAANDFAYRNAHLSQRKIVDVTVSTTQNVLSAISQVDPKIHLLRLGSVDNYDHEDQGFSPAEGYMQALAPTHNQTMAEQDISSQREPGNTRELTEKLEQTLLQFYAKSQRMAISDLRLGRIWGTETLETQLDPRLFNYPVPSAQGDIDASTLPFHEVPQFNAQTKEIPLLNIEDMVNRVELMVQPPVRNDGRINAVNAVAEVVHPEEIHLMCLTSELMGPNSRFDKRESLAHRSH